MVENTKTANKIYSQPEVCIRLTYQDVLATSGGVEKDIEFSEEWLGGAL